MQSDLNVWTLKDFLEKKSRYQCVFTHREMTEKEYSFLDCSVSKAVIIHGEDAIPCYKLNIDSVKFKQTLYFNQKNGQRVYDPTDKY